MRAVVDLRDDLLEGQQGSLGVAARTDRLKRVNSILSMIRGAESPLVSVRLERVRKAREALHALAADGEA